MGLSGEINKKSSNTVPIVRFYALLQVRNTSVELLKVRLSRNSSKYIRSLTFP